MSTLTKTLWLLIAAILVGDTIALVTNGSDDGPPSRWDDRVLDLVRFVEDKRELTFKHPVDVRFLTTEEYKKEAGADEGELTEEDKKDIAQSEGELRALGLIKKGVSLFDDSVALVSGGTLAFYDPDNDEMVIKGTELNVALKVTIVHELTHALQDQHFDLSREFASDNQSTFFQALGEGDASRIESLYVEELSSTDAAAYDEQKDAENDEAEDNIADIAPALLQIFGAPYALGEPMTNTVVDADGVAELNKLFLNPPKSDEGLIDAFALLDKQTPTKVARPKVRSGEKFGSAGDFGALSWYLVLSSFIDARIALQATDGWGGDSYLGYRKGDRSCVRAFFVGDNATDTNEMRSALEQWRNAFGSNTVTVTQSGDRVELDSCEPDTTPTPREDSAQSLALPIVRFELVTELLREDTGRDFVRCYATGFLNRLTLSEIVQDNPNEARLKTATQEAATACARQGFRP